MVACAVPLHMERIAVRGDDHPADRIYSLILPGQVVGWSGRSDRLLTQPHMDPLDGCRLQAVTSQGAAISDLQGMYLLADAWHPLDSYGQML